MGEAFRLSVNQARTKTPGDYCDGQGLWLHVASPSARNWIFRFTWKGKPTEMGLGPVNAVSLGMARDRAQAAREQVAAGINPIEARRIAKARQACPSFGEVAGEFIASKRSEWRNAVHASQWASLEQHAALIWHKPIDSIEVTDVLQVLKSLFATLETRDRVRGRIENVLDAAKARKLRSGENPAAWKGNLAHLLARRPKIEKKHFPAMPYADVPEFIASLRTTPTIPRLAIEYMILTVTRSAETRGAVSDEIDLDRAIWTLPPARMKAGLAHTVPLSPRAVEILSARGRGKSSLIFPGRSGRAPISSSALLEVLPPGATLHGFRSAFRDWCGEQTSFPREVAEHALARATGNAAEQAYARSSLLERRRELMNAWAQFCEPEMSANVTSIALARAQ